jgi:hypothetical protein
MAWLWSLELDKMAKKGTIMENSVVVYILFDSGWSPHGRMME